MSHQSENPKDLFVNPVFLCDLYYIYKQRSYTNHVSQYISRKDDKLKTSGAMNKVQLFTLCMLASQNEVNSTLQTDAMEILRLLNSTITAMDQLSACYNAAYKTSGTIREKKRCLDILANLQVSRSITSRRRTRIRNKRRPLVSFRSPCTAFNPQSC